MKLIYGGAYQGKLDYAKQHCAVTDWFDCAEDGTLDFSRGCVNHLERFTRWCAAQECDSVEVLQKQKAAWQDTVFVCRDISAGVVPMDAVDRRWREENGRLAKYLAGEAEQVVRVFCGLGQVMK